MSAARQARGRSPIPVPSRQPPSSQDTSEPTGFSSTNQTIGQENALVDVVDSRGADEGERAVDVATDQLQHVRQAGLARGRERHEPRATDEAGAGAERAGLDDVLPAPYAAVEQHLGAVADRLDDARQRIERRRRAVELAATVVRDVDGVRATTDGLGRVARRQDPLDDERPVPEAPEPVESLPGGARVVELSVDVGADGTRFSRADDLGEVGEGDGRAA